MTRHAGRAVLILLACGLSVFSAACGVGSDARYLSIATGGTGGVYYPYGGGIAKILNERLEGVRVTAEVTAASVDNLKLIRDGRADLAFALADSLADAVAGRGPFDGRPVPAASLAVLYANYTHLVTQQSSGIRSVGDLRGRVVSTGSPGSGTEVVAFRLLRAAGLNPGTDVTTQALGVSESVGALEDGKIAAFIWSGGLPTAAVQDLAHRPGTSLRLIGTAELLPVLQRDYGSLYFSKDIPAGIYRGVEAPVAVVAVANVLVVNRAMPEEMAYDIARIMFERKDDLAAIHPEARSLSLETAVAGSPAAFHPGAIRLYRDNGVWKP
jgi:TRAP transporter TAXI family solute receptor